MSDIEEKDKISNSDFDAIAAQVAKEYRRRKKDRKALEAIWAEIDRQLEMQPLVKYKRNSDGTPIKNNAWMPEVELPNQSQTLEVLCADARRMMFPENGTFFKAKAYSSDVFLNNFKDNSGFVVGSEIDPPNQITSDNVNDYVGGFVSSKLSNFDHEKVWDLINSEAFKYSVGVGRGRMASKSVFVHDASVTYNKSEMTPIIAPLSIKNVYLDDKTSQYMASGAYIGPAVIYTETRQLADVRLASQKVDDSDDIYVGEGWIKGSFTGLEADKNGNITLLEYEGDFVMDKPGGNGQFFFPNVILTVLVGKNNDKEAERLVRIQYNKLPFSSYIIVPYQQEHIDRPYGGSPLMKGRPIQKAASEALNRLLQSAMLNAQPPVQYDRDDQRFANSGGPAIYPGAQWGTSGDIEVHKIGDPTALLAAYTVFNNQYSDVTGVNPPRLGAQTVSHTTAYAKNQEIERGTVRTVDYVRAVLKSPMSRWLTMCYYMAKNEITRSGQPEQVYMDTYNAYVNVKSDLLPEKVCFEVYGSGGPAENVAEKQHRQSAITAAIQLNQLAVSYGLAQPLNYDAITKQMLRDAGITDVDAFSAIPQGNQIGQPVPGAIEGNTGNNVSPIALQGLQKLIA